MIGQSATLFCGFAPRGHATLFEYEKRVRSRKSESAPDLFDLLGGGMTSAWLLAGKVKNRISGKRAKRRRQALCERQRWRCHWCGELMFPVKKKGDGNPKDLTATIDHVIPLAEGGNNIVANTVAAHYRCNQARNTAAQRGEAGVGLESAPSYTSALAIRERQADKLEALKT